MISLHYLFETLNQKIVSVFLVLLLFSAITVSAAVPVNGPGCLNHLTGEVFQTRTAAPPVSGRFTYENANPIVDGEDGICYTYTTAGRCYIEGVPGPLSGGTWNALTVSVYDCPIDDYALPLGMIFSAVVCFYLRRSLSDVKSSTFKPLL